MPNMETTIINIVKYLLIIIDHTHTHTRRLFISSISISFDVATVLSPHIFVFNIVLHTFLQAYISLSLSFSLPVFAYVGAVFTSKAVKRTHGCHKHRHPNELFSVNFFSVFLDRRFLRSKSIY